MERSKKILTGLGNQYYRATLKSMGFTTDDLKRPVIGIANAWSECVPGHYNLRQVAQRVKDGIYRAGGTPIEAIQTMDADDWVEVSPAAARDGRHIALRVNGHSMEPMIYDGSIAIIKLCPEWVGGAVMAVYVGDYDATLKKVKIDSHGLLMLQPFNPDYETAVYTPEEQQRLNVKPLGILVEHRKRWV